MLTGAASAPSRKTLCHCAVAYDPWPNETHNSGFPGYRVLKYHAGWFASTVACASSAPTTMASMLYDLLKGGKAQTQRQSKTDTNPKPKISVRVVQMNGFWESIQSMQYWIL